MIGKNNSSDFDIGYPLRMFGSGRVPSIERGKE
jgi:hypothetical protein